MTAAGNGFRDAFLRALVVWGAALVAATELLGAVGELRRAPVAACWIGFLAVGVFYLRKRLPAPGRCADPVVLASAAGIAAIAAITALIALSSPPNSSDAMAYHLPRVLYWAEQRSLRFFPTQYLNQIMLQPFAEYVMLHGYLISGGDRWVNLGQWFAALGTVLGVTQVAAMLGAGKRGQALAALFAATLPAGILASTGAKNDYWMAMWLVAAAYFALRFTETARRADALLFGAALGLALLTKATAYLFAPYLVAAILSSGPRRGLLKGALLALVAAVALNAPLYIRNYDLSGSPLGFDSAQGDGVFRWRNETFGWRPTVSNLLRHLSEQVGARSERWNRGVYGAVLDLHRRLRIDPNDPATTWRESAYAPPRNANHETNAPNRWHLLLLAMALAAILACAARERAAALYALGLVGGLLAYCAYLKWQPFVGRLLLPWFLLGAPLVGVVCERRWRWLPMQLGLCLFLLNNARPALFENWVRPLKGPRSVLKVPREAQYFADMTQWNNQATYRRTVEALAAGECGRIGIDSTNLHIEYPLQALLRERKPESTFLHMGVTNASARYRQPVEGAPCAVVCLECAGDAARLGRYSGFARRTVVDRFVIFTP